MLLLVLMLLGAPLRRSLLHLPRAEELSDGAGRQAPGIAKRAAAVRGDWRYWSGWVALAKWAGFVLIGLIYFPLFWLALMSISERPLSGIPFPLSIENYAALFADPRWVAAVRREHRRRR